VESILTDEALAHPWFSRFAAQLPDGRRFKSLDSRLFDLIPSSRSFPPGVIALSLEVDRRTRIEGEALTMLEFARDRGGTLPRILALNHHPEIRDRSRQRQVLEAMMARGEVSRDWYEERSRSLAEAFDSPESEAAVMITTRYALLDPLRFHLGQKVRERLQQLDAGAPSDANGVSDRPSGFAESIPYCE
jgi:hypothetical protein